MDNIDNNTFMTNGPCWHDPGDVTTNDFPSPEDWFPASEQKASLHAPEGSLEEKNEVVSSPSPSPSSSRDSSNVVGKNIKQGFLESKQTVYVVKPFGKYSIRRRLPYNWKLLDAKKAYAFLAQDDFLGVDVEGNSSRRGRPPPIPCMVQVAGSHCVVLEFPRMSGRLSPPLITLLTDASKPKIFCGAGGDVASLEKAMDYTHLCGIEDLQKYYGNISLSQCLTKVEGIPWVKDNFNKKKYWRFTRETDDGSSMLSNPDFLVYACADAWATYRIQSLRLRSDRARVPIPSQNPPVPHVPLASQIPEQLPPVPHVPHVPLASQIPEQLPVPLASQIPDQLPPVPHVPLPSPVPHVPSPIPHPNSASVPTSARIQGRHPKGYKNRLCRSCKQPVLHKPMLKCPRYSAVCVVLGIMGRNNQQIRYRKPSECDRNRVPHGFYLYHRRLGVWKPVKFLGADLTEKEKKIQ